MAVLVAAEAAVKIDDILAVTRARAHQLFSGKIDRSRLSFGERAFMTAVRAHEGDYRDWSEIAAWAAGIADELTAA